MTITDTELQANLSKYLKLAAREDIYITVNDKTVARLTSPYQSKQEILNYLYGSLPNEISEEELNDARLLKIAEGRMEHYDPKTAIPAEEVYRNLGITEEDLAGSEEVEIE